MAGDDPDQLTLADRDDDAGPGKDPVGQALGDAVGVRLGQRQRERDQREAGPRRLR